MRRIQANFTDMRLVCMLLLATATSAAAENDDDDWDWQPINITEFLDTNEKIWTIVTTANESLDCKVDQKKSINRTDITFYRKHRTPSGTVEDKLHGKFTGFGPYYSMNVGRQGEDPTSIEELIYQGINNTCGVFELRNITRVINAPCYYLYGQPCKQYRAFDIRVRGDGGRISAKECMDWFKEEYPGETFRKYLYKSNCQNISQIYH